MMKTLLAVGWSLLALVVLAAGDDGAADWCRQGETPVACDTTAGALRICVQVRALSQECVCVPEGVHKCQFFAPFRALTTASMPVPLACTKSA